MWGTFRDSSGPIGLLVWGQLEKTPVKVELGTRNGDAVVKIASGADHLALLTRDGDIWTLGSGDGIRDIDLHHFFPGNSEQGQLGRVPEKFGHRGGRRGGQLLLEPDKIHSKSKSRRFR